MSNEKPFNLRLECMPEVTAWAKDHGVSINGAINVICREFLYREAGELPLLRAENDMLREKVIGLAMAAMPNVIPK